MQRLNALRAHLLRGGPRPGAGPAASPSAAADAAAVGDVEFSVTTTAAEPLDGRLLLLIAPEGPDPEPMGQVGFMNSLQNVQMAGVDVEALAPGAAISVGGDDVGFPLYTLGALPAGTYWVQAVLNKYETFHLSTGHTVQLPPGDQGDGQSWKAAPGNLYCAPVQMEISRGARLSLLLDQVMPEIAPPEDTPYIKHVTIKSELLSDFCAPHPTAISLALSSPTPHADLAPWCTCEAQRGSELATTREASDSEHSWRQGVGRSGWGRTFCCRRASTTSAADSPRPATSS